MGTEVRLLGGFSVHRAGEEVPPGAFGGRLPRTLVRLLATQRGALVPADVLIEALWPGRPPADPAANLRILVNRARKALGDPGLILTRSGGYALRRDDCVVDAEAFLAEVQAGRDALRAGRPAEALCRFRDGLGLWHGDPLSEDLYDDWAQPYRARLLRAKLEALEGGASAALAIGDSRQALELAEGAVALEPLRESAHLLVVRALASSGDAAGALAAYERMRERLLEDLGLDPSAEAAELQHRILEGDVRRRVPVPRPPVAAPPAAELPFVGRRLELEAALATVSGATPGVVLLSGEAGIGKSRLIGEVASRSTVPVLYGRAFLAERDEAWAVGRTLLEQALALDVEAAQAVSQRAARALANILPELEEARTIRAAALDPESGRALALQGGVRLLGAAACGGLLLVVDDVQWADPTSLAFLGRALRRVQGLGAVLAYRPDEVSPDSPVRSFLDEARSLSRAKTVALHPFSVHELAELVADGELVAAMATETTGTPLAVAEVIRILAGEGAVERDRHGRWRARTTTAGETAREAARAGQRRAIQDRVAAQPPGRRQVLALLALLRRETPARILAAAGSVDQPTVLADLNALARAGLVRLAHEGWAPVHDVVADSVTELLERPERGRLHAMLAQALRFEDADLSQVATHLEGAGDHQAAAEAFAQAARNALARFASDEAKHLADAGLRLAQAPALRIELLDVRAEARSRRGDTRGARDDLRIALALASVGPDRAHLLARTAMLVSAAEDYAHAEELIELALTEAGAKARARAEALSVGAVVAFNTNRLDCAEARSSEALALFRQLADAYGIADVLEINAMIAGFQGRFREAVVLLGRVVSIFEDAGKLLRVATPRAIRGLALAFIGEPQDAISETDHALELARALGDLEAEGYCLGVRASILATLRQGEEARRTAAKAFEIARRLGHRELLAGSVFFTGMAHEATGELNEAEACFRRCLEEAVGIPLFSSFAASGLARILIARGDLTQAEQYVTRALADGPPIALYDARLAAVELAVAQCDPVARKLVADALTLAQRGGHRLSISRLEELVQLLDQGVAGDDQREGRNERERPTTLTRPDT